MNYLAEVCQTLCFQFWTDHESNKCTVKANCDRDNKGPKGIGREREREKTDNDDYWITSSLSLRSLSVDGCNQNSLSHARDNVLHSFQFLKKSQAVCVQTKGL